MQSEAEGNSVFSTKASMKDEKQRMRRMRIEVEKLIRDANERIEELKAEVC